MKNKKWFLEKNIKYLRKKNKKTQFQFAYENNTNTRMIGQLESQKEKEFNKKMKLNLIINISEYFEKKIDEMLFTDIEEKDIEEKLINIKNIKCK